MVSSSSSAALRAASWSSSMAPSTACSASLRHGVWRPASSEVRSADETAGDADVIPGRSLPVRVAKQGSRMIGHDQGNTAESVYQVPQGPQRLLGVEQGLRGRPAHREDHLRLHDLDLAEQVWHARRDLVELRQAVLGRPALDHVANEDPLARQIDRAEDLGEQLAGRPDERSPGFVFHPSGPFPHRDQAGLRRSFPGNRVPAGPAQPAIWDRKSTRLNSRHSPNSDSVFFFNDTATTEIYTLSLHDALPISARAADRSRRGSW